MELKRLTDLASLEEEAVRFARQLASQADTATLVTLSGELGAGKTAFTQAVARTLGVRDDVTSPTFVLEKVYELPDAPQGFARLVHIDAYRLQGAAELSPLGFDEIMQDAQNLVLLEWPERVVDGLPHAAHALTFTVLPDNARQLTYA
jgi:tRNA threonylcarbamoyl adenosine modification protein YjeE